MADNEINNESKKKKKNKYSSTTNVTNIINVDGKGVYNTADNVVITVNNTKVHSTTTTTVHDSSKHNSYSANIDLDLKDILKGLF